MFFVVAAANKRSGLGARNLYPMSRAGTQPSIFDTRTLHAHQKGRGRNL